MGEKYPKKIIHFFKKLFGSQTTQGFFFFKGICDVAAKVAIIHKTI
jgi:hypothetical protein